MTNTEIITQAVKAAFPCAQLQKLAESIFGPEKLAAAAASYRVIDADGHPLSTDEAAAAVAAELVANQFHTFAEWKNLGFSVRKGQHAAVVCNLWRYTDKPGKAAQRRAAQTGQSVPESDPHFYMARSHLFHALQVQPLAAK